MRAFLRFALLSGLLALAAPLAAPALLPNPVLTAEEEARLLQGEIIVRKDVTGSGSRVSAVAFVDAPPERVWQALFDFHARKGEVPGLEQVTTVRVEAGPPKTFVIRFDTSVMGAEVDWTGVYVYDKAKGYCKWYLDPTADNGVVKLDGSYEVRASGTGSLLFYRADTDPGIYMPEFAKSKLADSTVNTLVSGIRKRATR